MKFLKYILLIFLLPLNSIFGQSELFEEANQAYDQGAYAQAISKYKQLEENGVNSVNLHYNLANAYYHNQDVGLSILHFEKARKLDPGNSAIEHNLKLAYLNTKDQIEPLPRLFFVSWWYKLLSKNNASQWGKRAILFAFISLVFLILARVYKKPFLKYLAALFIIICLSQAFLANKKYQYDYNHHFAILMTKSASLKETPNDQAKQIQEIHEGLKMEIIDHVDDWSQVALEDGSKAWLPSKVLSEI